MEFPVGSAWVEKKIKTAETYFYSKPAHCVTTHHSEVLCNVSGVKHVESLLYCESSVFVVSLYGGQHTKSWHVHDFVPHSSAFIFVHRRAAV